MADEIVIDGSGHNQRSGVRGADFKGIALLVHAPTAGLVRRADAIAINAGVMSAGRCAIGLFLVSTQRAHETEAAQLATIVLHNCKLRHNRGR